MLSKSSSKAIGILLPSLSNQIFASFVQGIEAVTKANGYETLLAHFGYDEEEEERKIASLLAYQVDGLILTESHHTQRTLQMIASSGVPVVETMELPANPIDMAVGMDHVEASYQAVKKLSRRVNVRLPISVHGLIPAPNCVCRAMTKRCKKPGCLSSTC